MALTSPIDAYAKIKAVVRNAYAGDELIGQFNHIWDWSSVFCHNAVQAQRLDLKDFVSSPGQVVGHLEKETPEL